VVVVLPAHQLAGGRQEMPVCRSFLSVMLVTYLLPPEEELFLWY